MLLVVQKVLTLLFKYHEIKNILVLWYGNIIINNLILLDEVIKKYKRAKKNLENLKSFGAQILHGVDAIKMKLHTDLQMRKFDRIVYNFPHAGFLGKEDDHRVIM